MMGVEAPSGNHPPSKSGCGIWAVLVNPPNRFGEQPEKRREVMLEGEYFLPVFGKKREDKSISQGVALETIPRDGAREAKIIWRHTFEFSHVKVSPFFCHYAGPWVAAEALPDPRRLTAETEPE
jgi:hypothetical protein